MYQCITYVHVLNQSSGKRFQLDRKRRAAPGVAWWAALPPRRGKPAAHSPKPRSPGLGGLRGGPAEAFERSLARGEPLLPRGDPGGQGRPPDAPVGRERLAVPPPAQGWSRRGSK